MVSGGKNRIDIRNLDEDVIHRLNQMARNKGISREQLGRNILTDATLAADLKSQENRYMSLVESLADVIRMNTDAIGRMEYLLEEMQERLDGIGGIGGGQ